MEKRRRRQRYCTHKQKAHTRAHVGKNPNLIVKDCPVTRNEKRYRIKVEEWFYPFYWEVAYVENNALYPKQRRRRHSD